MPSLPSFSYLPKKRWNLPGENGTGKQRKGHEEGCTFASKRLKGIIIISRELGLLKRK